MEGKLHHYNFTTTLAKKYSHSTYLTSSIDEPEQQVIVIVFSSSLFSSSHERETFLQKAQRLKALQHPHILPLLDVGMKGEQPFVVRDYLPSGSLRSHLKQSSSERLEPSEALNTVLQIGEALAYAHQQDISHGSLKPENILFDADGKALLTDFSPVSSADAIVRDQASEEYAFCYTAPEQFSGTWNERSDQYAIGYLTYELLAGQGPFATQTLITMIGNQNNEPLPLPEEVANQFPSLNTALLKTLAKEPDERFFDFSLFLEVIRSILAPQPVPILLHSTTSHSQSTHPLKQYAALSSSRQFLASPHSKPKTSEVSAPSNAEPDLAEPVMASRKFSVSKPKTTNSLDDLFTNLLAASSSTSSDEQEDTESSPNHQDQAHKLEVEEMTIPLLNSNEEDIPPKRKIQLNRRKILCLVPFGFFILALVIAAWNNDTAFNPGKKETPDALVSQKPTQAIIQSLTPIAGSNPSNIPSNIATVQAKAASTSTSSTTTHSTTPSPSTTADSSDSSPNPTPLPTPTRTLQTTTIDDSVMGTGSNQFNYVGGWYHSGTQCPGPNCSNTYPSYNNTSSWSNQAGNYVTLSFTGVQIKLYGVIDPGYGIGAVSIDGGSKTDVDFYASTHKGNRLLWTSPTLSAGTHTFKLRVTGNKNPHATNTYGIPPVLDRVDILS